LYCSHLKYGMLTSTTDKPSYKLGPVNMRALARYVMTGANAISIATRCCISLQ